MEYYTNLFTKLQEIDKPTIRTNKRIEYYNIPCGFDIETTSYNIGSQKAAFMYVWMIGIGHGTGVYYGRTWEELKHLCQFLQLEMNLSDDKRLVIYVHNLAFEFEFMQHHFEWVEGSVFSGGKHKPFKALCNYGIEFRDSYILSGFSLAHTAKNLTKHKVAKMVGDLDYSLIRHHTTPLTEKEMGYCENDIVVTTAYIDEQLDLYKSIDLIPMTNTGRVRRFVKEKCLPRKNNGKKQKYRQIMQDLTLSKPVYLQLKSAFMGGYTHANANYVDKTLEQVTSVDFTSSYPSVMVSEMFPISRFKSIQVESLEEFEDACARYCVVFEVKFTNIRPTFHHEHYISESKCRDLKKAVTNNGRVVSADSLVMTLTNIDYDIMKQTYEWDEMQLADVRYAHKNYLPKSIIEAVLELYQGKTTLKDVEGSEVEYLLSKGMLNSIYGMSVTDIAKDKVVYSGDWGVEPVDIDAVIEADNKKIERTLYYAWGIWITAYARRNLWTGILALGNDYVYSDTDSMKVLNYENHTGYFDWFNNQIIDKMVEMCDYYNLDTALLSPSTKEGKTKMMGVWDYEGTYRKFKTLGAKRYMVDDNGKLKITVAGLSKQNGVNYMLEQCEGDIDAVFEMFNTGLFIPAHATGKNTRTYINTPLDFQVTDYLGNTEDVHTLSGVHLEAASFTLDRGVMFAEFMRNLAAGYIFNGTDYV